MTRNGLRIATLIFALSGGAHVASAQSPRHVVISKLSYGPTEIVIHLGDTIEWENSDLMAHTATADANQPGGAWEILIPAGKSATFQPTKAGTISYFCRFHPNMKGQVIVLPQE